ncbi:MAG TPA: SPOR domain-containing protein [Bacteroidota bacterium]
MRTLIFLLLLLVWSPAPAEQGPDVQRYVDLVAAGHIDQVRKDLPSLLANFPDDPGVVYLQALTTADASEAVKLYQSIVDSHPASEWADDALYKIYQFYQALGLVRTAELKMAQLRREYPSSKYVTGKAEPSPLAEARPPEDSGAGRSEPPPAGTTRAVAKPPRVSVQTPSEPAPKPRTTAPAPARPFALQVGAFSAEANAGKLRRLFAGQGYSVEIIKRARAGSPLYLVWVGRYGTEEEARAHIAEISKKGSITPIVVTH